MSQMSDCPFACTSQADCPDTQFRCVLNSDVTYNTATGTYTKAGAALKVNGNGPEGSLTGETGTNSDSSTTARGTAVGSFTGGRCYQFGIGCFYNQCVGYQDPTERCNNQYPQCAGACEAQCIKCCNGEAPPFMC
jgi:hypothetical protein